MKIKFRTPLHFYFITGIKDYELNTVWPRPLIDTITTQLDTHCRLKVVQFLHKEYSVNIAVDYVSITAILHNFDLQ